MSAMEEQLLALRSRLHLYWCLPPKECSYTPRAPAMITQRLPITSSGLIGFDLHSCRPSEQAQRQGASHVFLEACDVGKRLGVWRLPASVLGCGWVRCWLPRALVELHNELVVRVMWEDGSSGAPSLSLADPGDWPELVAMDNQGGNLDGAIAIAGGRLCRVCPWGQRPTTFPHSLITLSSTCLTSMNSQHYRAHSKPGKNGLLAFVPHWRIPTASSSRSGRSSGLTRCLHYGSRSYHYCYHHW